MYKHLIYRGFDIQETEQSWIISMNSDGETSYKSALGGFCTLTLVIIFLLVLLKEG